MPALELSRVNAMFLQDKNDLMRLNDALLAVYAAPDLSGWAERSIHLMRQFLDGDFYGVSVCENRYSHTVAVWEPRSVPLNRFSQVFATIEQHHPLYTGWRRVGSREKAMRISDCVESASWRENPVYHEVFKPLGFKNQVGVWSELGPGRHLEIGCNRTGSDFTQHDIDKLELLRPHITQAYLNWCRTAELRGLPTAPVMLLQQHRLAASEMQRAESVSLSRARTPRAERLTAKEQEVIYWVSEGKANPEIGALLGISPRTVQKHLEHVFQKLNVTTRLAAATRVRELGSGTVTA